MQLGVNELAQDSKRHWWDSNPGRRESNATTSLTRTTDLSNWKMLLTLSPTVGLQSWSITLAVTSVQLTGADSNVIYVEDPIRLLPGSLYSPLSHCQLVTMAIELSVN